MVAIGHWDSFCGLLGPGNESTDLSPEWGPVCECGTATIAGYGTCVPCWGVRRRQSHSPFPRSPSRRRERLGKCLARNMARNRRLQGIFCPFPPPSIPHPSSSILPSSVPSHQVTHEHQTQRPPTPPWAQGNSVAYS